MDRLPYDVFISHSSRNKLLAEAICHTLESHGIRCWIAPRNIRAGEEWAGSINQGIKNSRIMLLIFTGASNTSQQVRKELTLAVNERKIIIPFRAEDCPMSNEMEYYLCDTHWLDAYPNPESKFPKLVQTLSTLLESEPTPVPESGASVAEPAAEAGATGAIIHLETDLDCRVLQFGKELCTVRAGKDTVIRLCKGKHKLEFVSLENPADRYTEIYPVEENELEDLLPVKLAPVRDKRLEEENRLSTEREQKLSIPDEDIISFEADDKFGYKVKSTGAILIAPKYERESPGALFSVRYLFSEGLGRVRLNGKWGFVDKTGKEVAPPKYDNVDNFREGLAMVKLNGKWGFVDKTGREVIPLKYDWAGTFSEGLAQVELNDKYGHIDKTGKEVTPLKYDSARYFREGLASVKLNGKYGFVDKTGKEVTPLKYDNVDDFSEGLAMVKLNGKCGYIDKTGKEVIPLKYDIAWDFSKGLAKVLLNGKRGCIDKRGKEIIPIKYIDIQEEGETYEALYRGWFGLESEHIYDLNGRRIK